MKVPRRWILLGAIGFAVWFAATFGVAFAVVKWREDSEPDFFCQEATRALYSAIAQGKTGVGIEVLSDIQKRSCDFPTSTQSN